VTTRADYPVVVTVLPQAVREFSLYYLRWRTRALAYMALFVDPYPPWYCSSSC
jgi:hypothetical protein